MFKGIKIKNIILKEDELIDSLSIVFDAHSGLWIALRYIRFLYLLFCE